MIKQLKILLLEDDPYDVGLLERVLKKSGLNFLLVTVDSRAGFAKELINFAPNLILSDHSLPNFDSLEALRMVKKNNIDIPFILVTGAVSEEFAVECMKAGADDYILKGSLVRLPSCIENILSKKKLKREKEDIESLHIKLQDAYQVIESKNKNITDSINYAKRIQNAMLPEKEVLAKIFPQSFILFRPKDIISGDFYWFFENGNEIFVAVADCTGHGVPGALMSMVGYNLLNEIIQKKESSTPKEILEKLNDGVCRILKQNSKDNQTDDGMDISLCLINKKNKKIEFAGANHQLFFIKKDGTHEIIKGNSQGVGGSQSDVERTFTSRGISFEQGDSIYLFTDGYADQFGGGKNKKMMKKNFFKLLKFLHSLDMEEQEKLLNEWLDKWKGAFEQTDDILLFGIKF